MEIKKEPLGGDICVFTSRGHGFGHDALLLADFAAPKPREIACDLGCGCGILPLRWVVRGREEALRKVCGVDIQAEAVEQFALGIKASGLLERVFPVCADIRGYGRGQSAQFNLVTCNPPYKAAGSGKASQTEPARTARHETQCTFGDICAAAARLLKNSGRLCICHKPERLPELFEEMRRHRLEPKRLRLVHKDSQSPPWLSLIEARLCARPGLVVEAPVFING
jgi:tRNA1(Val) A37 N6-methylase TrmN6